MIRRAAAHVRRRAKAVKRRDWNLLGVPGVWLGTAYAVGDRFPWVFLGCLALCGISTLAVVFAFLVRSVDGEA